MTTVIRASIALLIGAFIAAIVLLVVSAATTPPAISNFIGVLALAAAGVLAAFSATDGNRSAGSWRDTTACAAYAFGAIGGIIVAVSAYVAMIAAS
ncbi:hypothetical protein [Pseudarthrobacter sp. NamB4]|uniref:hypothetical protein n=1 Tax=Pseudarthrobacter sp. NamB4 TaxID=2576837 RepID=UPI0010FCE4C0|nr:hypothetical protein [Pseudarthrobacter sp. NamB4]TLM73208.1 hypothetical protein FDW81_09200 [Pseudarthrobacter sp. NamB4]